MFLMLIVSEIRDPGANYRLKKYMVCTYTIVKLHHPLLIAYGPNARLTSNERVWHRVIHIMM